MSVTTEFPGHVFHRKNSFLTIRIAHKIVTDPFASGIHLEHYKFVINSITYAIPIKGNV